MTAPSTPPAVIPVSSIFFFLFFWYAPTSGKNVCIQTHRLRPDASGTRDALDACCQRTYRSQRKTHRQCEFGRSSPRHRAFGRRSPRHLLTGRSVVGHFPSGRTVSGHFPSGPSHVRAFSFWTQPCQGIFRLDPAVSEYSPTGRVWTTRVMAARSRRLSWCGTSQQILGSHSQTRSGFQA